MDFHIISRELIRAIRGHRSQATLNARLGYKSNQVHRWESGSSRILWSDFVRFSGCCKISIESILRNEIGYNDDPQNGRKFFSYLIGHTKQAELASRLVIAASLIIAAFLFSTLSRAETKAETRKPASNVTRADMTMGLKNLATEDDVVEIRVGANVRPPAANTCAQSQLQNGILRLMLTRSMAQGDSCSVAITDGFKTVRIKFSISVSDD